MKLGSSCFVSVDNSTVVYLEGNLETKIFTDPVTGLVRRIREVAIRRNGMNCLNSKNSFLLTQIHLKKSQILIFISSLCRQSCVSR